MSRHDEYTIEFNKVHKKLKAKLAKQKLAIDKQYTTFLNKWIAKYSPYKVGDVLEVIDNKRIKFKRMVIYQLDVKIFDTIPMLNAYGWWLDVNNNPVKWNGSGYPLLNCHTDYKMELSNNQVNNPVID